MDVLELTPGQSTALNELKELFDSDERVVFLTGGIGTGRKTVAERYLEEELKDKKFLVLDIEDLFPESVTDTHRLKNQLTCLLERCNEYDFVCIKDIERAISVTTGFRFKYATEAMYTWLEFMDSFTVPTLLITSRHTAKDLANNKRWFVDIELGDIDRFVVIKKACLNDLSDDVINEAVAFAKNSSIEDIVSITLRANSLTNRKGGDWLDRFKYVYGITKTAAIDAKKEVNQPRANVDMVGIDDIIEEIVKEVIEPIKRNDPFIPICKGLLLHGPPGTGKSTIGRWLSYQLEGKIYLIESGPNESLLSSFEKKMKLAAKNAPAAVFIDDIDSIMISPDAIRKLLVLLDGINIKGRENVCVIATGMNITLVPDALIRGGRLEKCIQFAYPNLCGVKKIISNRFSNTIQGLQEKNPQIAEALTKNITPGVVDTLSNEVVGLSPSNIHLIIDSSIRGVASNIESDPIDIFRVEAVKIRRQISQSTQVQTHKRTVSEFDYFN